MKHIERIAVVIAGVLFIGTLAIGYQHGKNAPTPVGRQAPASSAIQPPPIQTPEASAATQPASHAPASLATGPHPRPEEIVRLSWQIQDQVARTVLTPAPALSPAEILTLPVQIQNEVRQAYQTATP